MNQADEQQIELLKHWWRANGPWVSLVLAGALVLYASWSYYRYWQTQQHIGASELFQSLTQAAQDIEGLDAAGQQALHEQIDAVQQAYPRSVYAQYAALYAAKLAVAQNDLAQAQQELSWALAQKGSQELTEVIRVRLVRILVEQQQYDQALQWIDQADNTRQAATLMELKGDILLQQGQPEQAREAYQHARDYALSNQFNRPYLEIKLDDLAVPSPQPATAAEAS